MPPDPDPNELIHIKHPKIKGIGGPVIREALDTVWVHKGWVEAPAAEVDKATEDANIAALTADTGTTAATVVGKEKK